MVSWHAHLSSLLVGLAAPLRFLTHHVASYLGPAAHCSHLGIRSIFTFTMTASPILNEALSCVPPMPISTALQYLAWSPLPGGLQPPQPDSIATL